MRSRRLLLTIAATAMAITMAGCSGGGERADPPTGGDQVITVTSTAFADNEPIPQEYSCDGAEVSPPLAWSGLPSDVAALALVVDDPDAPGGTFAHWVVANIDPAEQGVGEGEVPAGGLQVGNSSGAASYAAPCPPSGTHHYRFTVYALNRALDVKADESLDNVFAAIDDASVGQGTLIGTYQHR
jgi:Raf kinase inhibitor-like YbhB/YbcL family protein